MRGRFTMTAMLILAMLLPLAGVAASQDATPQTAPAVSVRENDCSFLIRFDDDPRPLLGDIACGVLDVPENWSEPEGRRLEIRYVVLKSFSDDPAPDPVVYLEGGPGGSALTGIEDRAAFFSGPRQTRDIVLFDQRGTRLSSPLRCAAYSLDRAFQNGDGMDPDETLATPEAEPPPPLPAELDDPYEIMQRARQTRAPEAAECAREIAATGVDLRQYNSIASAMDTVALIEALGYDQFNLYGISYGTRLALVIMREHPDRGIRSVVLDSTFPPEVKGFERYPEEPHEVVIQLFADCALDPVCNDAYPNLKERFIALLPALRETPVLSDDGTPIDDRDLIDVMQSISQLVHAAPYVPLMIHELERGDSATFVGIATGSLFDQAADEGAPTDDEIAAAVAAAEAAAAEAHEQLMAVASPARLFLFAVQEQIDALPEDESARLFGLLLHLEKQEPDREALADLVRRAFPEEDQDDERAMLLGVLASLADEDVLEVFEILEQTVTLLDFLTFGTSRPQFNAVECNEEIPFQAFENTVAIAQGLEIPEMALGVVEGIADQFAVCEVWPSGRAPAIESLPVSSDVPTLILAGAYDLQTPVSWNKSSFVTLANGTFVEFPMSGHGVIAYSACAEAVAEAFIAAPVALLNIACTVDLRPQWALPPGMATPAAATPGADDYA